MMTDMEMKDYFKKEFMELKEAYLDELWSNNHMYDIIHMVLTEIDELVFCNCENFFESEFPYMVDKEDEEVFYIADYCDRDGYAGGSSFVNKYLFRAGIHELFLSEETLKEVHKNNLEINYERIIFDSEKFEDGYLWNDYIWRITHDFGKLMYDHGALKGCYHCDWGLENIEDDE